MEARKRKLQEEGLHLTPQALQELHTQVPATENESQFFERALELDLRQSCSPFFPLNIASTKEDLHIAGPVIVQVQTVKDIGAPKTRQNMGNHPQRMLLLQVTDGHTLCKVLEFENCPQLLSSMPPGTKIQLRDIHVCKGTILLKPKSVVIAGGQVQRLLSAWRLKQDSVIRRRLDKDNLPPPFVPMKLTVVVTQPTSLPPAARAKSQNNNAPHTTNTSNKSQKNTGKNNTNKNNNTSKPAKNTTNNNNKNNSNNTIKNVDQKTNTNTKNTNANNKNANATNTAGSVSISSSGVKVEKANQGPPAAAQATNKGQGQGKGNNKKGTTTTFTANTNPKPTQAPNQPGTNNNNKPNNTNNNKPKNNNVQNNNNKNNNNNNNNKSDRGGCFKCGDPSHRSKECPTSNSSSAPSNRNAKPNREVKVEYVKKPAVTVQPPLPSQKHTDQPSYVLPHYREQSQTTTVPQSNTPSVSALPVRNRNTVIISKPPETPAPASVPVRSATVTPAPSSNNNNNNNNNGNAKKANNANKQPAASPATSKEKRNTTARQSTSKPKEQQWVPKQSN